MIDRCVYCDTSRCVFVFQFAVLMWLLTYVGALFNGLTLLILGGVTILQESNETTSKLSGFCGFM